MWLQLVWLSTLSIPVACVAWTLTHEEVFVSRTSIAKSKRGKPRICSPASVFTYSLANIVSATTPPSFFPSFTVQIVTVQTLDWRGYLIAFCSLVWVSNQYISVYNHLRLDIRHEQVEIHQTDKNTPRPAEKRPESELLRKVGCHDPPDSVAFCLLHFKPE